MAAVIADGLSKDPALRPSSAAIYDDRFRGAAGEGTSGTVAL